MLFLKLAAVGILVSILSQVLKHSGREEQAFLTSFAGLILVLSWVLPYIYELFASMKRLFSTVKREADMSVLQVSLIAMVAVLLAIQLKGGRAEYGFLINLAAGIFLFFCIVGKLEVFIRAVEQIQSFLTLDTEYIAIMLKMVGITYIAQFSSGICKDAGYQAIAAQIEIFGKLAILVVGMPVLLALLETIQEFLL